MCDPITLGLSLGIAQGATSVMGQNAAITAQQNSVSQQVQRSYAEQDVRTSQEKRNALEKAHISAMDRDMSASKALVRNTNLGIRGITAMERVSDENRVGGYNVASAMGAYKDATDMGELSKMLTRQEGVERVSSLQEQRPTVLTGLVEIASGALRGYMGGTSVADSMGYEGTPYYKKLTGGK